MFKQIIDSLPPDPTGLVITLVVAIGIGVGALTSLLGALHSRVTISLLMLCVGAVLGLLLPGWIGIDVNRSVTITIFSILFGLLGFGLHRICVAVTLGLLVAAVSLFILHDQTQSLDVVAAGAVEIHATSSVTQTLAKAWETAPEKFHSLAPWVALGAFVIAGLVAMLLPKIGMAALYSLGGTMLTLFCIRLGHESGRIDWLDSIKNGPMTIAVLGLAMLLVGFMTQIALLHRPAAESARKKETADAAA